MKVNLEVQAQIRPSLMRKLNPYLKQKRLTIQQAVDAGIKKRLPAMYLNLGAFFAAAAGLDLPE